MKQYGIMVTAWEEKIYFIFRGPSKAEYNYMFMDSVIKWKSWKSMIPPDLETLNVLFLVNIVENKRRKHSTSNPLSTHSP